MYTLMTGSSGPEQSFKNVRYSTINDENKYKSKDHLFIYFQNNNNGNKREIIYSIISISDKRLSSFFISLILSFTLTYIFFFPYIFRFNFVVSERNVHIIFCRHIWAELSLLFWTFPCGTFLPGGGGGGARAPSAPPLRTRLDRISSHRQNIIPDRISFHRRNNIL